MNSTKNCELVLDEIKKLDPDNNGIYYTVRYVADNANLSMRYDEFRGVLETLASNNQIRWGDKQHTAFTLLETGRSYKEIKRLTSKERWAERIWGFLFGIAATMLAQIILKKLGL